MRHLRSMIIPLSLFLVLLVLAIIFWVEILPNRVLRLRVNFVALSILGMIISLLVAGGLVIMRNWLEQVHRHIEAQIQYKIQSEAADQRRRFMRRLNHELQNPLTTIGAGVINLTEPQNVDAHRRTLTNLDTETKRLQRLVSNLRKLADLDSYQLEQTVVSVSDLLREIVNSVGAQPTSISRQIALFPLPQAPRPLPPILGDQDLLFQAVHNLLDNALKFTQPDDKIEIRANEDGKNVIIEVANTGPDIPESDIPYIWEELYRSEQASAVPGSGLGLAWVKKIVERHGGQVHLRSQAGQGVAFIIQLPSI
jgi:two-component system OmpR family sensor kinase